MLALKPRLPLIRSAVWQGSGLRFPQMHCTECDWLRPPKPPSLQAASRTHLQVSLIDL